MKAKLSILLLIFLSVATYSCTKDKFDTIPSLRFESVNTTVLAPDQVIEFRFHYTDKEGDIANTRFYIQKITRNCPESDFVDSSILTPENVPVQKNSEGELVVRYVYGISLDYPSIKEPVCADNDSCVFRFALTDAAMHTSDTVTSPEIVLIKR